MNYDFLDCCKTSGCCSIFLLEPERLMFFDMHRSLMIEREREKIIDTVKYLGRGKQATFDLFINIILFICFEI